MLGGAFQRAVAATLAPITTFVADKTPAADLSLPPDFAGAYGCTISGAGPTCVAVVESATVGPQVAKAMEAAFRESGELAVNFSQVVNVDLTGARPAERTELPML